MKMIERQCGALIYCTSIGPTYSNPILSIGKLDNDIITFCAYCGIYVCGGCAKKVFRKMSVGSTTFICWELHCTLCGNLLGNHESQDHIILWSHFRGYPGIVDQETGIWKSITGGTENVDIRAVLNHHHQKSLTLTLEVFASLGNDLVTALGVNSSNGSATSVEAEEPTRRLNSGLSSIDDAILENPDEIIAWYAKKAISHKLGFALAAEQANQNITRLGPQGVMDSRKRCQNLLPQKLDLWWGAGGTLSDTFKMFHIKERQEMIALVPDPLGKILQDSWKKNPDTTLLLLVHETEIPSQQQSLYIMLESLLSKFPNLKVLGPHQQGNGEGEARVIRDPKARMDYAFPLLGKKGSLAASLIPIVYPADGRFHNLEGPETHRAQEQYLDELTQSLRSISASYQSSSQEFVIGYFDNLWDKLFVALDAASFNPLLVEVAKLQFHLQRGTLDSISIARALDSISARIGFSLQPYRETQRLLEILEFERKIDFREVEKERINLIPRLQSALDESSLSKLQTLSRDVSQAHRSQTEYYVELVRLLREFDIQGFDSFRNYVQYVVDSENINMHLLEAVEFPRAFNNINERLASTDVERETLQLMQQIKSLQALMLLRLLPDEAQKLTADIPSLTGIVNRLTTLYPMILSQKKGGILEVATELEQIVLPAVSYYRAALSHSERMMHNAFTFIQEQTPDLTVIICDRFDMEFLVPHLNQTTNMSWVIVGSKWMIMEQGKLTRERWRWVHPTQAYRLILGD